MTEKPEPAQGRNPSDVLKGVMTTLSDCLFHVKGTKVYLEGFRDFLSAVQVHEGSIKDFIVSLEGDCATVTERIEYLIREIRENFPNQKDADVNRRNSDRMKVHGSGFLRRQSNVEVLCFLKDLSAGGSCIITNGKFERDEKVYLEIRCGEKKDKIQKNGEVAWIKQLDTSLWEIGVRFDDA